VTFDWVEAWWQHLSASSAAVSDQLFFRAFRDPSGQLQGIAPLMLTRRPGVGPLALRQLQFIGADPNITELRGIIARPEARLAVHHALLSDLRENANHWDWALYSSFKTELESTVPSHFSDLHWGAEQPCYSLALGTSFEELRAHLPRNIKESLRKCRNSLKRDGIELESIVVTERARVHETLEDFFRLHNARARQENAPEHRDKFVLPKAKRFLQDVCERFAERGELRIFLAKISGRTVATRIGFIVGGCLYLYYSGYEPEFGRYSIMTSVVVHAIQTAIAEGLGSVNLSTGRDTSKTRWRPTETLYQDVIIVSPSARGRLAYGISEHARELLLNAEEHWAALGAFTRRGSR